MSKMLYITAFPPNFRSGGQVFSYNALKDLAGSYDIDVIYFTYPEHEIEVPEGVNILKSYTADLKNCLGMPFFYPMFTKRFDRQILNELRRIATQYDVLYFDYTQIAIYSLYIKHPCKVIRCHDIMAQKFKRNKSFLLPWIKKCEEKLIKSAKLVLVPSEKDKMILQDEYGVKAQYTNEYLNEAKLPNIIGNSYFLFFGLWSRKENLNGVKWFVEHVYPLLDAEVKVKLKIMGGGMPSEFKEKYLTNNNIEYLGYVRDCYPVIAESKALIVPLFEGAGVKVKVLDSFTVGTPVIGTDVAFEGIPYIENLVYECADAQSMAACINHFQEKMLEEKQQLSVRFRELYDKNHVLTHLKNL